MKKYGRSIVLSALAFTLGAAMFRQKPPMALADEAGQKGGLYCLTETKDKAIAESPVMLSVLKDGTVVRQQEVPLGQHVSRQELPVGMYDLRLEGDGMKTLMKRGVQVLADQTTTIHAPMAAGAGVRIVEYATGGLPREEVAARLIKLEAAVADLQKKVK